MSRRELALFSLAAAVTLFVLTPPPGLRGQEQAQPKSPQAWTLGEAMGQLALNPKDVYLQYVALQLARQENRLEKTTQEVEQLIRREPWRGPDRRQQVDLFSLFTGALAVQESLQLDTMRGGAPRRVQPVSPPAPQPRPREQAEAELRAAVEREAAARKARDEARQALEEAKRGTDETRRLAERRLWETEARLQAAERVRKVEEEAIRFAYGDLAQKPTPEKPLPPIVEVATLTGPTIKSHPWDQMLAGKKPQISPLAYCVPEDFCFIEFRSLGRLLDAADVSDLWGTHLYNQSIREAQTQRVGERIKTQLALETHPLLRPFYDLVVGEVALTGSDLFMREGSDVTLLFEFKQPEVFRAQMDGFPANAEKARPDAKRAKGKHLGVDYVHLATPDRTVCVFAAYPTPNLHVRSNSKAAFERVLQTILAKGPEGTAGRRLAEKLEFALPGAPDLSGKPKAGEGTPVRRLGDSLEFAYIRTLMPRGAAEEDGFIYLSDPFIRRLVGPQLKLTERRRILCYNHLRMIGHASLLYRTQLGKPPKSLADLTEANCAPGKFGEGKLVCPDGGAYSLAADGQTGLCSIHGHTHFLTPCIEIPVTKVSQEEASEYRAFLEDYNRYWRTFFDPIGIRVQITPQRYRLETIVLPLIDNSIYTGLAMALGGKPEPLDALPIPKRTIFSVAARVNKEPLIQQVKQQEGDVTRELLREFGIRGAAAGELNAEEFLAKGLGNQVSMHLYDAPQMFDFNLPSFLGQAMGTFQGGWRGNRELLPISLLVTSLNAPVYLAIPVQDPKVVDKFLEDLDRLFAAMARRSMRAGIFQLDQDFYHLSSTDGRATRSFGLQFGPLKLRFFYERIGNAFYIASKPFILDDLKVASAASDAGPVAHAMARMRPENWNQVLPDFRLGWAENHREACLNNLSPLSNVARAFTSKDAAQAHSQADALYGVHFFCPEDGQYVVSADGKSVTCSVHGSPAAPRQLPAPGQDTALGKLLAGLAGTTAALTFHEDGLHAVLTIDRKP